MKPARAGKGSPPRMRGKACSFVNSFSHVGITPAYAGKSESIPPTVSEVWDHPRVCGEKHRRHRCRLCALGSPPRMRGKEERRKPGKDPARITPAYAGKRLYEFQFVVLSQDHPRVCGEKPPLLLVVALELGSPPRMRGKVTTLIPLSNSIRITPAYAGKSPSGLSG